MEVTTCKFCGNTFTAESKIIKYCSDRCKRLGYSRSKGANYLRICKVCGSEFMSSSPVGDICSHKCRSVYASSQRKEYTKNCEWCGKEFVTHRVDARCCSRNCSTRRCLKIRNEEIASQRLAMKKNKVETPRKKIPSLSEMQREAEKQGMSYGKYVALLNMGVIKND